MADEDKEVGAVYVPWGTFRKAVEDLGQGLPNQIDRSVWKSQSWGTQSQLITAFKFLGLTEDKGKPSASLVELVTLAEDERKRKLEAIFRERYANLFALDLTKATPDQLDKEMGSYGVSGETRSKAVRFFLSAMVYLGIPVSKHLQPTANGGGVQRRGRKPGKKTKAEAPVTISPPPAVVGGTAKSIKMKRGEAVTLSATADFFAMDPDDRDFLFGIVKQLEEYEKKLNLSVPSGQSQTDKGGEE